jgi:hypothetical protein
MDRYTYSPSSSIEEPKSVYSTSILELEDDTPEIVATFQDQTGVPREVDSERLKALTNKANTTERPKIKFTTRMATAYMEILDELNFIESLEDIPVIFSKKGRTLAIGILITVVALFIFILRNFL